MSHDTTHLHSPKFTIMTIRKEIGRFPQSWYSNVRVALWLQRSYTSLTLPFAMVCFILPFESGGGLITDTTLNATLNVPPRLFSHSRLQGNKNI
jgi:hypothetical protein